MTSASAWPDTVSLQDGPEHGGLRLADHQRLHAAGGLQRRHDRPGTRHEAARRRVAQVGVGGHEPRAGADRRRPDPQRSIRHLRVQARHHRVIGVGQRGAIPVRSGGVARVGRVVPGIPQLGDHAIRPHGQQAPQAWLVRPQVGDRRPGAGDDLVRPGNDAMPGQALRVGAARRHRVVGGKARRHARRAESGHQRGRAGDRLRPSVDHAVEVEDDQPGSRRWRGRHRADDTGVGDRRPVAGGAESTLRPGLTAKYDAPDSPEAMPCPAARAYRASGRRNPFHGEW